MLKIVLLSSLLFLASCTAAMPIKETGVSGEYVITRTSISIVSTLDAVKQEALNDAKAYCTQQGKVYVEKYSIDRARSMGQFPETTTIFTCASAK